MSTKFSHNRASIIARAIIVRALGTDPAPWLNWAPDSGVTPPNSPWPVFTANEGAFPDNCITVYEAEPQVDAKIMVTGEIQTHWGITVRVRGQTHDVAWQKCEDLRWDFNESLYNQTVTLGSNQYLIFAIPKAVPVRPMLDAPGSIRWFVNLNCLAVIQAYPVNG